jgi:isoquinoline 1-oxidoreductase
MDGRQMVAGSHRFPSDVARPGMLYGRVLRAPSFGAELVAADLSAAQKLQGVTAVRDGGFVGCAAPTTFAARKALETISATAQWKTVAQPSNDSLFEYLKQHVKQEASPRVQTRGSVEQGLARRPNGG